MKPDDTTDYNQPVAYDNNGRPLYAHPPAETAPPPPTPRGPAGASEEVRTKHAQSLEQYPQLNLSENEYVINEIRRHIIGILPIIAAAVVVVVLGLGFLVGYPIYEHSAPAGTVPAYGTLILPVCMVMLLISLIAYVAYIVYIANRLFITNESVIDEAQTSMFARKERTVSLENIEEVTFHQSNILQSMFDYGTVRMTIEGDHTAYTFQYVGSPKKNVDQLVNSIEACKAGTHYGGDH